MFTSRRTRGRSTRSEKEPNMPKIVVWSKPSCVQCTATYRKLDGLGLTYEVKDLTEHPDAIEAFRARGLLSAPVVIVGDDAWSGFNPIKLAELAAKHQLAAA